ncbi:hypothetical protein [Halothece sp. PCC 7418]|nr:hypothetical protein [Halothece sp. PCC 7418]
MSNLNSTQLPWETRGKPQTTEETSASADEGKPESVSGVAESVIRNL